MGAGAFFMEFEKAYQRLAPSPCGVGVLNHGPSQENGGDGPGQMARPFCVDVTGKPTHEDFNQK
jgi:hypothetical protein